MEAIRAIPRHYFLDSAFSKIAYEDRAFPIDADQTISQPYTVAFQSQLLKIKKGDKVLEIGTGSMYQTAILAALGAKVYTIERQKLLFEKTTAFKNVFGDEFPDVYFSFGDGFEGLPEFAPFDKIIITAAAPKIVASMSVPSVPELAEINAPTMVIPEIALAPDIKGVCKDGVTLHTT